MSEEQRVVIIDTQTQTVNLEIVPTGIKFADHVSWNFDDTQIALLNSQGILSIWNTSNSVQTLELNSQNAELSASTIFDQGLSYYGALGWHPSENQLALYDVTHATLEIWDMSQQAILSTFPSPNGPITNILWSEQGLITYGRHGPIEVWDITTGNLIDTISIASDERISHVEWNPNQPELFYVVTEIGNPNVAFQDVIHTVRID